MIMPLLIFSWIELTAFTSMEEEMAMAAFLPMTGYSGLDPGMANR